MGFERKVYFAFGCRIENSVFGQVFVWYVLALFSTVFFPIHIYQKFRHTFQTIIVRNFEPIFECYLHIFCLPSYSRSSSFNAFNRYEKTLTYEFYLFPFHFIYDVGSRCATIRYRRTQQRYILQQKRRKWDR